MSEVIINEVKINGKGLWTTFRGQLAKGAYEKLLAPAPMKEYITDSSRLNNGITVLAVNPKTDSREITLQIFIEGDTQDEYLINYNLFVKELQKGEISFAVPKLKTIFRFVYTGVSSYGDYGLKRGKFTVKFIEPDVTKRETI